MEPFGAHSEQGGVDIETYDPLFDGTFDLWEYLDSDYEYSWPFLNSKFAKTSIALSVTIYEMYVIGFKTAILFYVNIFFMLMFAFSIINWFPLMITLLTSYGIYTLFEGDKNP